MKPLTRSVLTYRVWRVFSRNLLVFRKTWLTNISFNFIEPLLYLAALGLGLGSYVKEVQGLPYLNFIAPGLIASSAMWATSLECTYDSFIRMEYQKIYHAVAATPVTLEEVVVGDMLFGAFKSVLYGTVILFVLFMVGLVPSPWALLVPLVLVLCGLVIAELSMLWTGLVPNIETFSYFFTLVITPMFLFSGVFFPLDGMPAIVRGIAWFMPLYHIVELVRGLVLGRLTGALGWDALWLVVFALLFFRIPPFLVRRRLIP